MNLEEVIEGFAGTIKKNLTNRLKASSDQFALPLLERAELAAEAASALYIQTLAGVPEESLTLQRDALATRMKQIRAAGGMLLAQNLNGAIADVRSAAWLGLSDRLSDPGT